MKWRLHRRGPGLAWRDAGNRQGPPVVLLHGFFQDGRAWAEPLRRLPRAEVEQFHWIAVDLPGHGASAGVQLAALGQGAWPGLALLLDDAVDAALGRDLQKVAVVGYSFGGRAAAWWLGCAAAAMTQDSSMPRRGLAGRGVAGALLESAHPGLTASSAALRRQEDQARAQAVMQSGVEAFGQLWANLALFATQKALRPSILRAQQRIRLSQSALGLADHLRSLGTGTMPQLDHLPAPPWPTAFLAGELDTNYAELARSWQQAWPRTSLVIAPGAGHNVHLESPALWWECLRSLT